MITLYFFDDRPPLTVYSEASISNEKVTAPLVVAPALPTNCKDQNVPDVRVAVSTRSLHAFADAPLIVQVTEDAERVPCVPVTKVAMNV
jgi:hypothetical protein